MPRPPTVSRVLRLLATLYRPRARQGYQGHSPWLVRRAKLYAPVAPAGHGLPFRSFDEPKRSELIIAAVAVVLVFLSSP